MSEGETAGEILDRDLEQCSDCVVFVGNSNGWASTGCSLETAAEEVQRLVETLRKGQE